LLPPSEYGITATQEDRLIAQLAASHTIRITIDVFDRDETPIKTIQPQLLGGSVTVDASQDVSRSLNLELLDPEHKLQFDSTNPAEGALYADNFIGVKYGVFVEDGLGWVDIPVFFGPMTSFKRDGDVVIVEAQGKESLGLEPHSAVYSYALRKGMLVRSAIQNVMGRVGETKFRLGMIAGKLAKGRAVVPGEQPWRVCVGGDTDGAGGKKPSLMSKATGNFYLFYDGRGYLTAKRKNATSVFTFKHTRHVLTEPSYEYDVLSFRNHAEVRGGVSKKTKKRVRGEYTLPASHPLSPSSLQRNGKGRFLTIFHEADNLKTAAACRVKARRLVEATAFQGVSAQFEALPIPMLEENDTITLDMGTYTLTFQLKSFTIPLTAENTMSVGYTKRAQLPRGRRSF
jgi:hypothetical protein